MTERAAHPTDWWVRPRVVLPVVAALLLVVALLTPQASTGRLGDDRVSAHLSGALGARGLKEVAARLGWRVVLRDSVAAPTGAPGARVHAVLSPPLPVTDAQAHRYLEAVRGGDALLLSLGDRNALSDSLGVRHTARGGESLVVAAADTAGCGARSSAALPPMWPDGQVHLWAIRWMRGRPADAVDLATITMAVQGDSTTDAHRSVATRRDDTTAVAAAGFTLGRGRVVVLADPDLLRNDVIRHCAWGADVVAVRMLEWLRDGGAQPRATLEFDELHQGYGVRHTPMSVTARFLGAHPVGRTILQGLLAALVLLLALAPRPILPHPRPRAERRDPLEQADALGHAYQQVRATRTAARRLLQGVRSRVERAGTGPDDAFLDSVLAAAPDRAADVALVRQALAAADADLPAVGAALRRIEASLTITTSTRA